MMEEACCCGEDLCCDPPDEICFTATNITFTYPPGLVDSGAASSRTYGTYTMTLTRTGGPPGYVYTGTVYFVGFQSETTVTVTCNPDDGVVRGDFYDRIELYPGAVTKTTAPGGNILAVECEPFSAEWPVTGPSVLLAAGDIVVTCDSAVVEEGAC